MDFSAKALIISHLALAVAAFTIGYTLQKEPTIQDSGETTVRYLPQDRLKLPKFNGPSLTPVSRIYFLPGPKQEAERDTVYVPMPTSYTEDFLVTKREPISQSDGELQFKYYDPRMDKQVIDSYAISPSPWSYGLDLDFSTPVHALQPNLGTTLELTYQQVSLNVQANFDVINPDRSSVMAGASFRLFGN